MPEFCASNSILPAGVGGTVELRKTHANQTNRVKPNHAGFIVEPESTSKAKQT